MNVYMTGLIYLTGCGKDVRAFAPEAPGHHASLWIEASALEEGETQWWDGLRRAPRVMGDDDVIEFEIPGPAMVRFPGAGKTSCSNLDDGLPKLKKKKKNQNNSEEDEGFDVDPATAVTNAEVAIRGGSIRPRRAGKSSLVEWTITDPGLTIVVQSRNDPTDSGTITLKNAGADVIFANMHEMPKVNGKKDDKRGNHVPFFTNLNPDPAMTVYAVAAKVPGSAGQLSDTTSKALLFFKNGDCWCGKGTPCCCFS